MVMCRRTVGVSILPFLFLFVAAPAAVAQFARGSVYGTITDANGGVVPGVTVTLRSTALLRPETTVTNESGAYRFPALPQGEYEVTAELDGFTKVVRPGIALVGGAEGRIDMILEVARLAEAVTVSGSAPPVDLTNNTVQVAYNERTLKDLPTSRDVWSVMESMPGVVAGDVNVGGSAADSRGNQVYAYGSQGAENTYDLNGVNLNDPATQGSSYVPYDEETFAEMRVETGAKSPEVRGGGVYINMTTKAGGNTFSGGGSFFGQDNSFNADNIGEDLEQRGVESSNAVLKNVDYAGRLGGPIMRNRIWFFGAARVRQVDTAVLNFTRPDGTAASNIEKRRAYTGKVTSQVSPNNKVEFYYNWSRSLAPYRGAGPNTSIEATNLEDIRNNVYQGTLTSVFGDRAFMDVRGGSFLADFAMLDTEFVGPNPVRSQELTTTRNSGAPGQNRHHFRTRYRVDAALTYYLPDVLGDHQLRGGIQWEDGGQEVDTQVYGDHWLFFDTGRPARIRVWNSPSHYNDRYRDVAFHVNDVWNPSPRVTISAGVRVSMAEAYWPEQTNRDRRSTRFTDPLRPGTYFPEEIRLDQRRNILEWANPAARLSLTIDPRGDSQSAIRASYGRYYSQLDSDYADVINPNLARFRTLAWNDLNGDRQPQANELDQISLLDFSSPTGSGLIGDLIDSGSKQPLEDQVVLGYDHQLGQHISLGVAYHHRRSARGIGFENVQVPNSAYIPLTVQNPLGSGTFELYNLPTALRGMTRRILTNQDDATREYNGIEFRVQRRFSGRWQAQAALTIGAADGMATDHFRSYWQDPNLVTNQYGADPYDSRYLGKLSGSYLLPFDVLAGVNYRYNSGRPYTPTVRFTGLNQGDVTINAERPGTSRLDGQHLLDVRLEKRFNIARSEIGVLLDTFNLLNIDAVLSQNALAGTLNVNTRVFVASPTARQITSIMPPRTLLLGVRWSF